ncbi:OsmC-like protein [Tangfeifania diversioriginum]|uniref:OsmC-like protein n=1 Tax=Tangfeifania diversioriginum TaxID=1168035 RepID=A0A1M6LJR6_9BACT|nr:OsmC family protein [Tangfeifania diversioriginum]SHJ71444.1 OsmC-like protein [Tangfeifania diversioriginum]
MSRRHLGDKDLAANPVGYLLASCAGCINVVAHLTARELGITFKKLNITIEGNLNPAKLLGDSNDERAGFKQIDVQFSPITDATPGHIENWIETIKKTMPGKR